MTKDQNADPSGGCECSSKAAPGPESPATKSGCCGGAGGGHGHEHHHHHAAAGAGVVDPVCGMTVDPESSKHRSDYRGTTYHFCSVGCRTKFDAAPQQYLEKSQATQPEDVPEGTIYTCPMHPQIR
jgi:Cu+-exporting ATPase